MIVHPMTVDRALQINGRIVEAWMVREGIRSGPTPSFRDVRLADAQHAIDMIIGGGTALGARLEASNLSRLFAWAVLQSQMS